MSQSDVILRERATYVGEESTFGATPGGSFPNAMVRCFPFGEEVILGDLAREMLDVGDERVRRDDNPVKVAGLKIASKIGPLKCALKVTKTAAQLSATGTVSPLTPRILCRHAFGAEHAAIGTTISGTASTTTVINVADATVLRKGTWIAVQVGTEMEETRIDDIDTGATPDAVTVSPPLSAAPATNGTIVRNLYNYCRASANTKTLTIQQGFVDATTADHTANGCYGDLAFELGEFGKIPMMTLSPTVSDYTVGAQSLGVASASDEMGVSIVHAPRVYLASTVARATRLATEGITIEQMEESAVVRDPGATSTIHHIVRVGGRPVAAKANVKLRFDGDYDTAFTAGTALRFVVVQQIGTGTTASFHIWEMPVTRIVGQPKRIAVGKLLYLDLELNAYPDTTVVEDGETGEALDFVKASLRYCFG